MSNFTPLVQKEYEFDGDTITMHFRRLKRKDMLAIMPRLKKFEDSQRESKALEKSDDADAVSAAAESVNESLGDLVDALSAKVPEYTEHFEGLIDSEGHPIGIKTVCEELYFMRLCVKLCMDMIQESTVTGGKD